MMALISVASMYTTVLLIVPSLTTVKTYFMFTSYGLTCILQHSYKTVFIAVFVPYFGYYQTAIAITEYSHTDQL